MGPEKKILKKINEKRKKFEITDVQFLSQYLKLMNDQIKQMSEQIEAAKLNRKHIISVIRKLREKK